MIDRDDNKFLFYAPQDDKNSASSDAGSDHKVKMQGLAQRVKESGKNGKKLPTHVTGTFSMNENVIE
jgi:hypothetical protein